MNRIPDAFQDTFRTRARKKPRLQARVAGLEPATFGSVDRCSIQLSYTRIVHHGIANAVSRPLRGVQSASAIRSGIGSASQYAALPSGSSSLRVGCVVVLANSLRRVRFGEAFSAKEQSRLHREASRTLKPARAAERNPASAKSPAGGSEHRIRERTPTCLSWPMP